jgi:hypothetical protein
LVLEFSKKGKISFKMNSLLVLFADNILSRLLQLSAGILFANFVSRSTFCFLNNALSARFKLDPSLSPRITSSVVFYLLFRRIYRVVHIVASFRLSKLLQGEKRKVQAMETIEKADNFKRRNVNRC